MEFIYSTFENYGIWILFLIVFLAQLGLPIGSAFFLMWYGSTINSPTVLITAIPTIAGAAILGDISAYSLGHHFSQQLKNAEKRYNWLAQKIQQSQKLLDAYGTWLIWLSRFLVTGLGPFVNYMLGGRQYPIKPFLTWVILGEIIFVAELMYFGHRFKDTWEDLLGVISDAGWLIALVLVFTWLFRKLFKKHKHY